MRSAKPVHGKIARRVRRAPATADHVPAAVDSADRVPPATEAVAVDDISFGYGVLARLNEGAKVTVQRQAIDRELWVPTMVRFAGEGRALFFRKLVIDFAMDWFDYRLAR